MDVDKLLLTEGESVMTVEGRAIITVGAILTG